MWNNFNVYFTVGYQIFITGKIVKDSNYPYELNFVKSNIDILCRNDRKQYLYTKIILKWHKTRWNSSLLIAIYVTLHKGLTPSFCFCSKFFLKNVFLMCMGVLSVYMSVCNFLFLMLRGAWRDVRSQRNGVTGTCKPSVVLRIKPLSSEKESRAFLCRESLQPP